MAKRKYNKKVANKATVVETPEIEVPAGMDKPRYIAKYNSAVKMGMSEQDAKLFAAMKTVENAGALISATAEKTARAVKNEKLAGYAKVAIPAVIAILEKNANDQLISLAAEIEKAENALRKIFTARKPGGSGTGAPKAPSADDTFLLVANGKSYGITNISALRKKCGCKTSTGTTKFGGKKPESETLAKWFPGSKNILNWRWDTEEESSGVSKISADSLPDSIKSAILAKHTGK